MRNWKLPSIILSLLIVAMLFRWTTVSSQAFTFDNVKFQKDNWNSSIYQQRYSNRGEYVEKIVSYPSLLIPLDSKVLTIAWGVMTAGSVIWLLFAVSGLRKKD